MSDNLPVPAAPEPTREVARADTDSWADVVGEVAKFAGYVAGTEFVPKSLRDSPAAVTAAIMYGREIGLPPMTALTQTHVIEGKPSMSAEAMRALVLAAGHDIEVVESNGARCVMRGKRRGSERWSTPVEWTIDAARAAGLTGKKNWQGYPRQMLQARCTTELLRLVFPDVILGFRSIEEMEDLGAEEVAPIQGGPTTTVTRKRAAKKTPAALPAAPVPTERPVAPAGPPLPGEDGFEDLAGAGAPPPVEEVGEVSEVHGEGAEDTSPAEGGDNPANSNPVDVTPVPDADGAYDVEVVEEELPIEEPASDQGENRATAPPRTVAPSGPSTRAQHRGIFAMLGDIGVEDVDEERHLIASTIVGRDIDSFNGLTKTEAGHIIETLTRCKSYADLNGVLDAITAHREGHAPEPGQ